MFPKKNRQKAENQRSALLKYTHRSKIGETVKQWGQSNSGLQAMLRDKRWFHAGSVHVISPGPKQFPRHSKQHLGVQVGGRYKKKQVEDFLCIGMNSGAAP